MRNWGKLGKFREIHKNSGNMYGKIKGEGNKEKSKKLRKVIGFFRKIRTFF